jgi:hypothetical protein
MALTNLDNAIATIGENNRQLTELLKASIAKEENEKKILQQVGKNTVRLEGQIKVLASFVCKWLDEFEAAFDNDEQAKNISGQISPEIARDYLDQAIFMENNFGRRNNRIEDVKRWYNNYVPFNSPKP